MQKRYLAEVRRAWFGLDTQCGKSPDRYHMHQIFSYHLPTQRFEFVNGSELLNYLEDNPSAYERAVGTLSLFGVEVAALRDLSILDEVTLEEEYTFLRDGKRTLRDAAYLKHIRPQLYSLLGSSS